MFFKTLLNDLHDTLLEITTQGTLKDIIKRYLGAYTTNLSSMGHLTNCVDLYSTHYDTFQRYTPGCCVLYRTWVLQCIPSKGHLLRHCGLRENDPYLQNILPVSNYHSAINTSIVVVNTNIDSWVIEPVCYIRCVMTVTTNAFIMILKLGVILVRWLGQPLAILVHNT